MAEQQNNNQSNNQNNGQNQVITWPIVNTELQDYFDNIKNMVRGLYQMAAQQKSLCEQVIKENKALKDELEKIKKGKKTKK